MAKGRFKLLLGLIAGTALGAAFAPGKGSTLRKKIQEERKSGGDGTKAIGKHLKGIGDDIAKTTGLDKHADKIAEHAKKAQGHVKEHAAKAKDQINKAASKLKKEAKDATED